jgi:peptidoglycan-N-acetylglucosamine deacetylase
MFFRYAAVAALLFLAGSEWARAEPCPANPNALGTSRVLAIDPKEHTRLGALQYDETLPLDDHEVVLTFDDGPLAPYTNQVLDGLAAECVKATFFVVGQMAEASPALVRRAHREGHTIGTHTERHAYLNRIPVEKAKKEIKEGIASIEKIVGDPGAVAPFFRFPYLDSTDATEEFAIQQGLGIWSVDFFVTDWKRLTPEQVVAAAIGRIERKKKGMLLLHDIHERTATALPALLQELKRRGYRIVHVVPVSQDHRKTDTNPAQWAAVH